MTLSDHALAHRGVPAKCAGGFEFMTDLRFADCLWATVIRSPHPSAVVAAIDIAGLLSRDGVEAVFTWADVPKTKYNPALSPPDRRLVQGRDKLLLTRFPRHVGDGIGVVVARTAEQAREAAANAKVEWREKPAVLTLDEAIAASRILGSVAFGDESARDIVRSADVVVEGRYEFAAAQHNCLEPHACAATARQPVGLEIWTNSQCPSEVRRQVAGILGLPETVVRVRKIDEGGGFGAKQDLFEEALIGWLALRLGRSVRLTYTRPEELTAGRVRAAGRIDVALGFDQYGRLLGSKMSAVLDSGAYASHTPHVLSCMPGHVVAVYPRARHWYTGVAVVTNTTPAGAYRGYGVAEANFAVEQGIDSAAARLGLDPIEIRMRNVVRGSDGRGVADCLGKLAGALVPPVAQPADPSGKLRSGRGIAIAAKHSVAAGDGSDVSTAIVTLQPGPAILLVTGTCDSGTGSSRALAQIVAAELGVPCEAVLVREGDTAAGLCDIGSTAQRSVFVGGEAARQAARLARADIVRASGAAGHVTFRWPYLLDASGRRVADLADLALGHASAIGGRASVRAPGRGASYCALAVDVLVDSATGQIRVTRAVAAVDSGTVIDVTGARGQVLGGIVQGIGLACFDEWLPGPSGAGPGSVFAHGAPGPLDAPATTVLFCEPRPGSRPHGLGELPVVPVAAAVANAVTAATGVRCTRTPMRPAQVWTGLRLGLRSVA